MVKISKDLRQSRNPSVKVHLGLHPEFCPVSLWIADRHMNEMKKFSYLDRKSTPTNVARIHQASVWKEAKNLGTTLRFRLITRDCGSQRLLF